MYGSTYAQLNPDYNTYMAQQTAYINKTARESSPGTKWVGAGTPDNILMPQGMADGTDHTKYYNAAQGWRDGGYRGKYTPPNLSKGETQGKIDYSGGTGTSSKSGGTGTSSKSGSKSASSTSSGVKSSGKPAGSTGTLGNQTTPTAPSIDVQQPSGSINYDTSISVGQATDPNRIRSLVNTAQQIDAGSATGDRAVDDYTKSMNMNNQAQMDMAVQGANSQQMMNSQQKRSESAISGLNDQAAIYADAADRFRQALGVQTSVEAAQMSYNYGQQANNIRRLKNIARNNP